MSIPHAHSSSAGTAGALIRGRTRPLALVVLVVLLAGTMVGLGGPAQAGAEGTSRAALRSSVLKETNKVRARAGCAPLRSNAKLKRAAQLHANDMARNERVSHRSSNGMNWPARIRKQGYRKPAAENLADGYAAGADVVRAWLNSPVHRRNLRDCRFKRIGIGFNGSGEYWVQDFGF